MQILLNALKDILSLSSNMIYSDSGWSADFFADTQMSINKILDYFDSSTSQIDISFKDIPAPELEDFSIGNKYPYTLILKINEVKKNFFSTPDSLINYVTRQFTLINWEEKIVLPFEESLDSNIHQYKDLFHFLNKLIVLYADNTYVDTSKISFVLFSDKPTLIPIANHTTFDSFKNSFDKINKKEFEQAIDELSEFLTSETVESHRKEKKAIFVLESAEILKDYNENERFFKLIENTVKISKSIQSSFTAYLKNFSYKKLELELKKDLDYFIKSINDSLSALQTQALGLPIATALTQLSKDNLGLVPFIVLIVFSLFVGFNSFQQQKQIAYIKLSLARFFKKDNVEPVVAKDDKLQEMSELLESRIKYIKLYISCIYALIFVIICYSIFNLWLVYSPENCFKVNRYIVTIFSHSFCIPKN